MKIMKKTWTEQELRQRLAIALPEALMNEGWIDTIGGNEWNTGGEKRANKLFKELWRSMKKLSRLRGVCQLCRLLPDGKLHKDCKHPAAYYFAG